MLLRNARDVHLLPIAAAFARADESPLVLLQIERRPGEHETVIAEPLSAEPGSDPVELAVRAWIANLASAAVDTQEPPNDDPAASEAVANGADDQTSALRPKDVVYLRISTRSPAEAVIEQAAKQGAKLLIVPQPEIAVRQYAETLEWQLLRRASCETIILQSGTNAPASCKNILVAASGGANASAALTRAADVAEANSGQVTALYVEPGVDEVAPLVGERILKRIARRALLSVPAWVRLRVEVADTFRQGLIQACDDSPDLVLVGASPRREIRRLLTDRLSSGSLPDDCTPALGIVRAAMPLANRLGQFANRVLQTYVPQLSREQRVSLVERVQSSSQWNFDFSALMCLSTLIASLGLLLNSGAVLIGAMLVAPLMTPIVGSGLAIVQGNALLFRRAIHSVLQGFVLAFLIALAMGLLIRLVTETSEWPNAEMLARSSPNVLDLLVAFVSGLVAAYAMGRPNLTSALPGVAIAAALIPPIATAGMAAAWGHLGLMAGALLLFLTNIVAIALATSLSLRAVGIRDTHVHGTRQRWSRIAAAALSMAVLALAVYESVPDPRVPVELRTTLREIIEQDGGRMETAAWQSHDDGEPVLRIEAQHATTETGALLSQLAAASRQHVGRRVDLQLEIRIVQRATSSP